MQQCAKHTQRTVLLYFLVVRQKSFNKFSRHIWNQGQKNKADKQMQKKITWTLTGFSVACLSAVVWPVLPHPLLLTVILLAACLFHSFEGLRRHLSFVPPLARNRLPGWCTYSAHTFAIGFIAGSLWMASLGYWYLCWQLPEENNRQISVFTLQVAESQSTAPELCRVKGVPVTARFTDKILQPKILLYWRTENQPCPLSGQTVQVSARLKKPSGLRNPGAPDRMKWLLSERIVRTGSIKTLTTAATPRINTLHEHITKLIDTHDLPNGKWSRSLLVGNRDRLTAADWELLKNSGTAHLFSISGMHLGLVALWVTLLARLVIPVLQLLTGRKQQRNMRPLVAVAVILLCLVYAALANWQLPVVRALLLVAVFVWQQSISKHICINQRVWLMISMCCVLFPFSLFSGGFYLSIMAVILIWFLSWRYNPVLLTLSDKIRWAIKLQIMLSIILCPLTLLWFDEQSFIAPLINVVAIPAITLLLPVGLTGLTLMEVMPDFSSLLLHSFDAGLGYLMFLIEASTRDTPLIAPAFSTVSLICLLLGIVTAVLPSLPGKWYLAGSLFLPAITDKMTFSSEYWYLHVFDAGQGTALMISRDSDAVLIDTGAAYSGNSVLKNQVAPALTALGIEAIRYVFISHHDNDHAGGMPWLNDIAQINNPPPVITPTDKCQHGFSLRFKGLTIKSLWPEKGNAIKGNNYSCVLVISDGVHTILAPGDIERWAEYELLYSQRLPEADILIAPHHGSRTSSGNAFIRTVSPRWVVYTQGIDNRWGFPDASVTKRFSTLKATQIKTAESGYLRFRLSPNDVTVHRRSQSAARRWYHRQ